MRDILKHIFIRSYLNNLICCKQELKISQNSPLKKQLFIFLDGKPYTLYYNSGSTQNDREHLYEALDYVAKGKVKVMTETFPLEEISDAYDKVVNGNVRFKAVIKPSK